MTTKSAVGAYHTGYSEKLSSYNKAVGLKLRFVRDIADLGMIEIGRVDTLNDTADGHTKVLERLKFIGSRKMMGVAEMNVADEVTDEWTEIVWHQEPGVQHPSA